MESSGLELLDYFHNAKHFLYRNITKYIVNCLVLPSSLLRPSGS